MGWIGSANNMKWVRLIKMDPCPCLVRRQLDPLSTSPVFAAGLINYDTVTSFPCVCVCNLCVSRMQPRPLPIRQQTTPDTVLGKKNPL